MAEAVANPLRFAAREYDSETGLYYMRARYYDPASGRFSSEDPIGLAGGINPYVYAGNNPVTYRDPSGVSTECPDGTAEITRDDGTTVCQEPVALEPIEVNGGGGGGPPPPPPAWPLPPGPRRCSSWPTDWWT